MLPARRSSDLIDPRQKSRRRDLLDRGEAFCCLCKVIIEVRVMAFIPPVLFVLGKVF